MHRQTDNIQVLPYPVIVEKLYLLAENDMKKINPTKQKIQIIYDNWGTLAKMLNS